MSRYSDTITVTFTHDEITTLTIALWQAQYYQKGETPSKPTSDYRINITNQMVRRIESLDRMLSRGYCTRLECMKAIAEAATEPDLEWA